MKCRLLFHRAPQSFILASEEVLTRRVGEGLSPISARINVFDPPAVLIGFGQDVFEEVNVEEAKRLGFEIGRRPTGGGAIVMDGEATPGWEIWLPKDFPGLPSDVEGLYRHLSRVIVETLRLLGVEARYRPKNDVEVGGRKVCGMGLLTLGSGLMICGTILLDLDVEKMLRVLRIPVEKLSDKAVKEVGKRIVTLRELLGKPPSIEEVKQAFSEALRRVLGLEVFEGELSEAELKEVRALERRYGDPSWVFEFRRCTGFEKVCTYKTPGGLVRIHAKVSGGRLEQIMITGDFFAYPQRAVLDLEAWLKHVPIDAVEEEVERFFEESKAVIHGLSPRDLAQLIRKCLEGL